MSSQSPRLSKSDFHTACLKFIQKSNQIGDTWELRQFKGVHYLVRETVLGNSDTHNHDDLNEETIEIIDDLISEQDDAALVMSNHSSFIIFIEHHIVYSPVFNVPVLYFHIRQNDGQVFSLDKVLNYEGIIHSSIKHVVKANGTHPITGALSQGDHPLLGLPFFYLHPCETESLMNSIAMGSNITMNNYILAWLSAIGPAAGCMLDSRWA